MCTGVPMRLVLFIIMLAFFHAASKGESVIGTAYADSLGDYKKKKHAKRKKVTEDTCEEEYIKRCSSKCPTKDTRCT